MGSVLRPSCWVRSARGTPAGWGSFARADGGEDWVAKRMARPLVRPTQARCHCQGTGCRQDGDRTARLIAAGRVADEIGRASCRERAERVGGGGEVTEEGGKHLARRGVRGPPDGADGCP